MIASVEGTFGYGKPARSTGGIGGSLFFSGASNSFVTTPDNTDFSSGTNGNFTIEWFQYFQSNNSFPRIFSQGTYSSATISVSIEGSTFYLWMNSGVRFSTTLVTYINQWVHFAICRSGTDIRVFQNGTQIGSTITYGASFDGTQTICIGNETIPSTGTAFTGYITNFRWNTNALYIANFTKPSSPLTAVPGTVLLLLTSTNGTSTTDSSGTGKSITNTNVTWDSRNPF